MRTNMKRISWKHWGNVPAKAFRHIKEGYLHPERLRKGQSMDKVLAELAGHHMWSGENGKVVLCQFGLEWDDRDVVFASIEDARKFLMDVAGDELEETLFVFDNSLDHMFKRDAVSA